MSIVRVPVRVHGTHGVVDGAARVQTLSDRERSRRGLRWLGILWAAALCSVLVPILHFVLVPSLLFAGPIVAYVLSRQSSLILGGAVRCPDCGGEFELVKTRERWPFQDVCSKCHAHVRVERVSAE